jgi:FMN phosphatase YigB (HAD superfamily)
MKKALITDADNTLFDWVDIWYRSFTAMLNKIEEITGIPEGELYSPISAVHQQHGTSEYAFLIEEIPILREKYGERVTEKLSPAIDAFRAARREALRLYPGVMPTLKKLKANGIITVSYTESTSFYVNYRFRKLELDTVIDYLYSSPDHSLPYEDMNALRKYPRENYLLKKTVHRYTPQGEKKPNPHILSCILNDIGVRADEAVYIGDHPKKDIAMAQQAGVLDILASYGAAQHREQYELLRSVTHWSRAEVDEEKAVLSGLEVTPTIVVGRFDQILREFDLELSNEEAETHL